MNETDEPPAEPILAMVVSPLYWREVRCTPRGTFEPVPCGRQGYVPQAPEYLEGYVFYADAGTLIS